MVSGYDATDPADDISLTKISSGAVYQLSLAGTQTDTDSNSIDSSFVATDMSGLVWGEVRTRWLMRLVINQMTIK